MRTDDAIETHWKELVQHASPDARTLLQDVCTRQAGDFASAFYDEMQRDRDAAPFLALDETIRRRLHESMLRWINDLLTNWEADQVPGLVAAQRDMGNVHARIGIQRDLIMRGARVLKRSITRALLNEEPVSARHFEAAKVAIEMIDMALEVVENQHSKALEVASRKDEAYRSYAATIDMSLERERQKAALVAWENQLLRTVLIGAGAEPLPPLSKSSFGFWLRHKAPVIFPSGNEFSDIIGSVARIEENFIPFFSMRRAENSVEESKRLLDLILIEVKQIDYLLEALFENLIAHASRRDAVTQLLSRRFESTILAREVELSLASATPFAAMLIAIDNFTRFNERYGYNAGDKVLQHVANIFASSVRSGDFLFRHGGEEFMIVCVELTPDEALNVAEKIRKAVAAESIALSASGRLSVTVSIGVAGFDGHPDYQILIERAEDALREAKNQGRNICVLSQ